MSPVAGAKLALGAAIFGLVGGIAAVINPPDPPSANLKQSGSQTASARQSEQPPAPEQQWVSHYGDYYVTCYVTNGVRWYSAINQTNYNDAQVNQTPSAEMWEQICGSR